MLNFSCIRQFIHKGSVSDAWLFVKYRKTFFPKIFGLQVLEAETKSLFYKHPELLDLGQPGFWLIDGALPEHAMHYRIPSQFITIQVVLWFSSELNRLCHFFSDARLLYSQDPFISESPLYRPITVLLDLMKNTRLERPMPHCSDPSDRNKISTMSIHCRIDLDLRFWVIDFRI